ncbi:PEP-CTERM/exosortase system-associated acyltransferase [Ideonella livida]|uniref:PEP-CTERM/exosortase system-associated acyltransferase n=1 Tax=Ideonella livida TaxID=2707176 RepID=A0A7C9PJH2_9BURK|nr:PEP-CTERM/exosortase system-associated acyltransferase [Ideonella livida]NDY93428.1 PEP-CTERM/exosortase system-associated acyltransferase [Ideonella livida]
MDTRLATAFSHHFELVHAGTDALRAEVFRLRYQVYVRETGFEAPAVAVPGLPAAHQVPDWEQDEYDSRSDFMLVRHRASGRYLATVRLVLPDPDDPMALFPMETHARLDRPVGGWRARQALGEVSRFAISRVLRHQLRASLPADAGEVSEAAVMSHVIMGLYGGVMQLAHRHGITHCYSLIEPALMRLVMRLGVVCERIGPETSFRGRRVPCLTPLQPSIERMRDLGEPLWALVSHQGAWAEHLYAHG